jgi:uncharacterized phiE125 gp8 family phage protein
MKKLITPPLLEPISLNDAKEHLRVDASFQDDDSYISDLITVAREFCEKFQNRAYLSQTWEAVFDRFPGVVFELPNPPLQSVVSIKYYDKSNTEFLFDANKYFVDTYSAKGRVCLNHNVTWSDVELRPINSVIIRFVCGYGSDATSVPSQAKHAIKLLIAHWYENREPIHSDMKTDKEILFTLSSLLKQDKIFPV